MRSCIFILALSLLLLPRPEFLSRLDGLILDTVKTLLPVQKSDLKLALVDVPAERLQAWLHDPFQDTELLSWFERQLASGKTIALSSSLWPRVDLTHAELLLLAAPELDKTWLQSSERWSRLQADKRLLFIADKKCVSSAFKAKGVLIDVEYSPWAIEGLRLLRSSRCEKNKSLSHSLFSRSDHSSGFFWTSPQEPSRFPSAWLTLYQRYLIAEDIRWTDGKLLLDSSSYPLSNTLSLIPLIDDRASITSLLELMDSELTGRGISENILWLSASPEKLQTQVQVLNSFYAQSYLLETEFFPALELLFFILFILYLFFLLPKLSLVSGILMSCLLAVLLLIVQVATVLSDKLWLPLGVILQFIFIAHLLMLFWLLRYKKTLRVLLEASEDRLALADLHLKNEQPDLALLVLHKCADTEASLELYYRCAQDQEKKRFYDKALQIYLQIKLRRRRYKDVADKISYLMRFQADKTQLNIHDNTSVAKTLVLSDANHVKPVLGRYEIERELGRGAMGVVYLARDPRIARQVAIKTLDYSQLEPSKVEDFKARFFREAEAVGRLNHPDIVSIYDVGEERDLAFIAMDYIQGKALSAYIKRDTLLAVEEVYKITLRVAEALHYAHGKNLVHRDIKPANIMYDEVSAQVTVTDFGIARLTDDSRTRTGDIFGSPLYMTPEQLKGEKVDLKADIYSLGVSFYQLLTGGLPFDGDTLANLSYQVVQKPHKPVRDQRPELPISATRIVNKALQKDPSKRYADAMAMADALRSALQSDF